MKEPALVEESDPVSQRYIIHTLTLMSLYVILNVAAIFGVVDHLSRMLTWVFALAVAFLVIGQIWATMVYMRDADEFLRGITARRFIAAAGITMAIYSTWGFLEVYAGAVSAPTCMIFGIFWGAFGAVSPFIRSTR